ncbi:tRNA (adenosine(37)-N6)-dimethylallyltransferase MiaA [Maribacter sp. 4U21]|uniref:tRNA (adenosine(37)-N6)-dimethylallyltransferase MiaA n=1 Tax=Maribacter sp. 4U21 TaxID=1889779 RepID=UPI000C156FA9|nr:tRNA (adenosine(37)-N6)-dimethylallyltransferase MiaA [Maribacter sp. 4U21]PIB23840.1 tRNA (adenosine(37)-N6)-dimethylallyltransferase MiaA [Maribacter sp. 4U21]
MNKVLISVVGPTAIGKTKLAILLAEYFQTEIISADSRQFFKEMSIGTAVPSDEELAAVPHHFIQNKSIMEFYSVGDFEKEALQKLKELFQKKAVVVMVGGSGLYVNAVTKGLDEFPKIAEGIRTDLNKELETLGLEHLQTKLKALDPEYYSKVAIENPHRIIRALEVCISSGKPYSSFLKSSSKQRDFKVLSIGINAERSVIYERINARVDVMMEEGLLNEVTRLEPYRALNALQTVGYKELFQYLDENWDLEFAISEIKKNTRRFAKRQLTWFKKTEGIKWVPHDYDKDTIFELAKTELTRLQHV